MVFRLALAALIFTAFAFAGPVQAGPSRHAALVIDAATGEVLFEQNADKRRIPASLVKMMTLYMTFEALEKGTLKLNQRLPVSTHAAQQAPTKLGLAAGQSLKVEDAILGLVTKSANDAAAVLGEALAGSEPAFARAMTVRARKLGMKRTTFRNASGLPARGQYTTARDMAVLSLALLNDFPKYYPYFGTERFRYSEHVFGNHNRLLASYNGTDGIKTGYTRASGFNIAASAVRNDRRLIAVVVGWDTSHARDARARELLDTGFTQLVARVDVPPRPPKRAVTRVAALPAKDVPAAGEGDRSPADAEQPLDAASLIATWGIQVGAFRHRASAEKEALRAAGAYATLLGEKPLALSPVVEGERRLFRARLGGLTQDEAASACRHLKARKFVCVTISPEAL